MQQNINKWLDEEAEKLNTPKTYEERPSLKLQPNQITEITVDFSKPFDVWTGEQAGKTITKKIIPVSVNGTAFSWWLNVKNPMYREIVLQGKAGKSKLKVLQTGSKAETK